MTNVLLCAQSQYRPQTNTTRLYQPKSNQLCLPNTYTVLVYSALPQTIAIKIKAYKLTRHTLVHKSSKRKLPGDRKINNKLSHDMSYCLLCACIYQYMLGTVTLA